MGRLVKKEKGITLIALVITIIILLLLAAVSINVLFDKEGIFEKAKWSSFQSKLSRIEESVVYHQTIGENGKVFIPIEEIFEGEYDNANISDTLKKAIVDARENKLDSELTQDEINKKYEELKDIFGKISGVYYINSTLAGKEKTYLYDTYTNTVLKINGEKIFGKVHHLYKIGTAGKVNSTVIKVPTNPDFSNHKGLEAGWIPIYTTEDYKKIGTEAQNYDIYDLTNTKVGTYNMNKNAKYRLMNDIDFANANVNTIKYFKGTFDGNGYYIKNVTINTSSSTDVYYYYSKDNFDNDTDSPIGVPAGLFDRVENATIQNLGIENANVTGVANVGILAGEIVQTTIENCLIKNSTATSNGKSNSGAVGGLVGWTYKKDDSCIITNVAMNNVKVKGASVTSGMVAVSASDIIINNSKVENSEIDMQATSASTHEAQGGILGYSVATTTTMIDKCYVGNTNFKNNLNINNLYATCGGIIGSTHWRSSGIHSVTVKNCSVENSTLAAAQNCGGIFGEPMYGTTNCTITNCNSENVKAVGKHAGGICGYAYLPQNGEANLEISNCNVNKFSTEENIPVYQYGHINFGGVLGGAYLYSDSTKLNIFGCKVTNSQISYYSAVTRFSTLGGVLGSIYCNSADQLVKNCIVENTEIKLTLSDSRNEYLHASGIAGDYAGNVENCSVNKAKILLLSETPESAVFESGGEISYPTTTGIVKGNSFLGKNPHVYDCSIKNTEIRNNLGIALGVLADTRNVEVDIQRINIEDSLIQGRTSTAGVTQYIYTKDKNVNIDTVNIKNTDIISEERHAAGIVTFAKSYVSINNCNLDGCTIKNLNYKESNGMSKEGVAYAGNVAGIVGVSAGCSPTNCTVKNTELVNNYMNTGGIVAQLEEGAKILKCNVENITISSELENVGGICGYSSVDNNNYIISECTVNGGNITSKSQHVGGIIGGTCNNTKIKDSSVKNLTINTSNSYVGGIIGKSSTAEIDNCDVIACKISGKDKAIGGIAGEVYNDSNIISNCNVEDCEISLTGADAKAIGGIVGNGCNTSTGGTIDSCNVLRTKISGIDYVGGISGVASATIKNCKVDGNTSITGRNSVGGIQGFGGVLGNISRSYTKWTESQWKTLTENIEAIKNVNIENCTVKNATISGTTNLNYVQGQNSYYEATWSGTKGEDVITNSPYENVSLKTI